MFPGTYPIREGERISDVLERSGGFSGYAYLLGAVFTRESVRKAQQQRLEDMLGRLESDVARVSSGEAQTTLHPEDLAAQAQYASAQKALIAKLRESRASGRVVVSIKPLSVLKGSPSDITLEDGDAIFIPEKINTVNVIGSVYNPTALIFNPDNPELKYYLALTGGPTRNAEEKSMYVVRADGTVISKQASGWFGVAWDSQENRWGFGQSFEDFRLDPGDTILVPEKIIKPNYMRDVKDITQILYQIAVAAGVTIALF
jgi:protein involved in polysaccharide export with SLBB domain